MRKITYFILVKSIAWYIKLIAFLSHKRASYLAYRFFSEPREGKLSKDKLPKVLKNTFTETFTEEETHFQVYVWEGNENTVLLVHGWESNASRWENLLPFLQRSGSTIVALDAPAHGLSGGKIFSIPQYAQFIHKTVEKYQPQYLIGHSIGGKTCLYYQYLYPNNSIQKMVILGAPSDFTILIKNFARILDLSNAIVADLEARYIEFFQQQLEDFSGQKFASHLKVKGLIAHDVDDDVVSVKEGLKIAQAWKDAQYIETKGLGHSMHNEALYQNIYEFLFIQ
ncbi:alpha/beta fold hydrolase [Flavobacterium luminosum]|uniref:Alpha/beta hydrolase n=1 Tax=Flavobacterium luminosum TaxID=2949086 RepID=A0ABT0TJU4_9FLAO|nr:alpha/beta fold hydrolase [Flavobacterium sp. HXWNR70]MCL9807768.1 alpha/beta hydrolase [Flavobacterium sp. HXWNR70]